MEHATITIKMLSLILGFGLVILLRDMKSRYNFKSLRYYTNFIVVTNISLLLRLIIAYLSANLLYQGQFQSYIYMNILFDLLILLLAFAGTHCFILFVFSLSGLERSRLVLLISVLSLAVFTPFMLRGIYLYVATKSAVTLSYYMVIALRYLTILKIASMALLLAFHRSETARHRIRTSRSAAPVFIILWCIELISVTILPSGITGFRLSFYYLGVNLVSLILATAFFEHFYGKNAIEQNKEELIRALYEKQSISKRESEIIGFICEGMSNKEIALDLSISEQTVKHHIYNIYKKFGINSRVELINIIHSI